MNRINTAIAFGTATIPVDVALLLRYAAAGSAGTTAHFAVLIALVESVGAVVASTLGAIAGCIINYLLARHLVFAAGDSRSFPKFVTVAGCTVIVNAILMQSLVPIFPVLGAQIIATATAFILGFGLNKSWTFSET